MLFAELAPELDGYPEGPSNMFFRLMLNLSSTHLQPYSHMYWMEWDVKPVRSGWLDALSGPLLSEPFWMKGGRYRGRAFDELVQRDPSSWMWVGHLNGNALYALHDAEFNAFLQLVMEREPPSHFWKPFDVAIWKTLHDLPYSWHLYQVHGDKFITTSAIRHLGFTVQPAELRELVASSPHIHLVHGDRRSAGTYKYDRKFVGGVPRSNGTLMWRDEILASMRISLLVHAKASQLRSAAVMLTSAQRFFPGAIEYVVVVPEKDVQAALTVLPQRASVKPERGVQLQDDQQPPVWSALWSDQYTVGDYVFHASADSVLFRPLLRRDLFIFNKPILTFDRHANLKETAAGCEGAMLQQVNTLDVSQSGRDFLYPRSAYALARQFLDTAPQQQPPASRRPSAERPLSGCSTLSAFWAAFLYAFHPQLMSWTYRGTDAAPEHSLSYAFTSLLPQISCTGDAAWAELLAHQHLYDTQLAIMHKIASGLTNSCDELESFVATHRPSPL